MQLEVGVNLAGYLDSTLGVGHAARLVRAALETAGVPVAPVALTSRSGGRLAEPPPGLVDPSDAAYPVNLVCVNADALVGARRELSGAFLDGRPTIGVWWWEAGPFPDRWLRAFDHVDELWVGSAHVARELAPVSPVPVVRMPLPVEVAGDGPDRDGLGLPDGFLFLSVFDYNSVVARKNPLGAIEAFERSGAAALGARLVLKCIGSEGDAEAHRRVSAAAEAADGVQLLEAELEPDAQGALLASCDCLLSLHRSEGFGLPVAEAMSLGKPAIVTGYAGPLDYVTPANSYMVDWRPVAIGPGNEPYPADGVWAEPDLDQAARLVREVVEDPDAARARGERARADIRRDHSLAAAGGAMAARLRRLASLPADRNGQVSALDLGPLRARIAGEPPEPAPDVALPALRRLVRSALLRATRMHSVHQRDVGEEIADALSSLDERIRGVAMAQASIEAHLAELERRLSERGG